MLYRIFDPTDSGAPLITVGYDHSKDEPVKASVADAFRISNWVHGASFVKAQKAKISNKDVNEAYVQLMKQDLMLYGRLQAAMEILMKTQTKWMSSKGELSLPKLLNISDKPDQHYRVQAPEKKVMESFTDERLDVLLMFLDQLQEDVSSECL